MIDFSAIQSMVIPEGKVKSVSRNGIVIWNGGASSEPSEPAYTNLKDQCVFYYNQRYSHSGGAFKALAASYGCCAIAVPIPATSAITIRWKGAGSTVSSYPNVYTGNANNSFPTNTGYQFPSVLTPDENGVYSFPFTNSAGDTWVNFNMEYDGSSEGAYYANLIITVNEEIV